MGAEPIAKGKSEKRARGKARKNAGRSGFPVAVGEGGGLVGGAEGAVELGDGLEAGLVGDVGDAAVGLAEEFGGVLEAEAGDVFVVGEAGGLVEDPGEVFGADLAGGGGLGETDLAGERVGADVAAGAGDGGGQLFVVAVALLGEEVGEVFRREDEHAAHGPKLLRCGGGRAPVLRDEVVSIGAELVLRREVADPVFHPGAEFDVAEAAADQVADADPVDIDGHRDLVQAEVATAAVALRPAAGEDLLPLLQAEGAAPFVALEAAAEHRCPAAFPAAPAVGEFHFQPRQGREILLEFRPAGVSGKAFVQRAVDDAGHGRRVESMMCEIKHQKMRVIISRCVARRRPASVCWGHDGIA